MKFTKMQGLGNDYIYVDCTQKIIDNPSETAKIISDRHFGIGSDGLVLILLSDKADFRMRMFNSDGSEAEMCGNAIRCVGKYVFDNKLTDKATITIETLAGTKVLQLKIEDERAVLARVDMGEPILTPREIPVDSNKDSFVSEPVEIEGRIYEVTAVSMGNPHAISYVEDVIKFPLYEVGPKMETHKLFPRKVNAEFVQVVDRKTLKMRVWERGAGETLACGTGACATLVASVLNGVADREATIKLLGGDLLIEWSEKDNHVYMTGPAVKVFDGEIDI
ncbi:diaminopimelate epimerase [Ruminiclostridium sufflavum DSM 19573]|uniref:Diaminopimelate epimerase n=1 Tax=Ruminiclostridium sufflavum DSM 19573 TaxID=1121337 RepID=A0A318XI12_9FIRM|nr:diaminopimelate epimerase [Ruminiclostridium sufflavum]PYG86664.1 diaminopimelate epimerase [Ruminiclostridium sufflavum DSM 19573]